MVYAPSRSKITDKVCIVEKRYYNQGKTDLGQSEPISVEFSAKVDKPPANTIAIVNNIFTGPFTTSHIMQSNANFYSWLTVENAIPSSHLKPKLRIDLKYWALNELFLQGLIEKNGKLTSGIELVAVTYGPYSTMVLKDGELYRQILGK